MDMTSRCGELSFVREPATKIAPIVYVIDAVEFPFDFSRLTQHEPAALVRVPVRGWDDALTPWPVPALREGDAPFAGLAGQTLSELRLAIASFESRHGLAPRSRAICGYSLGGLFSLYAFVALAHDGNSRLADIDFDAVAALSASVWYPGWVDYLRECDCDLSHHYAWLSVGSKEKRGGPKIVRGVEDAMGQCADLLRERGCSVDFKVGPGNHIQHQVERYEAGLAAMAAFCQGRRSAC